MPSHCRACGEPIYNLNPRDLFSHDNKVIRQNLEAITGIKIAYFPHLPSHICSCCYLNLHHAVSFRKVCLETHNHLMKQDDASKSNISPEQSTINDPLDEEDNDVEYKNIPDTSKNNKVASPKKPAPNIDETHQETPANKLSPRVRIMRCRDPNEPSKIITRPLMVTMLPKSITNASAGPKFWTIRPPTSYSTPNNKIVRTVPNQQSEKSDFEVTKKRKYKPRTTPREKKYVCDQCGWAFSDLSNMKDHALRHSGVKKFKCDACGNRFFTRPLLKLHVRVAHLGEKPFVCKYCGMGFRNSPTCCRHERKFHAEELPYVCNLCGKTFVSKVSLQKHQIAHENGELIHRCKTCNKTFKDQLNLRKHNKTMFHLKRVNQMIQDDQREAAIEDEIDFDFADSIIEEVED